MNKLNRFNWIAKRYDQLAKIVFGDVLQRSQLYFIGHIPESSVVLIMGGGSGDFLKSLLGRKAGVSIYYVEASSEMLKLSREKTSNDPRVIFVNGTEQDLPPGIAFDVIVTNFFLDVFRTDDGKAVVKKLSSILKSGGIWIVTDFQKSKKIKHRVLLKMMFLFFRITSTVDAQQLWNWESAFGEFGLKETESKLFYDGFIKTSISRQTTSSGQTTT